MSLRNVEKSSYDTFYGVTAPNNQTGDGNYRDRVKTRFRPFHSKGVSLGHGRGLALQKIIAIADQLQRPRPYITIMDAGCGLGDIAIHLALQGFTTIGVDFSERAIARAKIRAAAVNAEKMASFVFSSLEEIPAIPDNSIDIIVGMGALHHFIKYPGVPGEFYRVLKPGSAAIFVDSFCENPIYKLFQNKEKMERLGDVRLNRKMIRTYFKEFNVEIMPVAFFTMLDKLYPKFLPDWICRRLSYFHYYLDNLIPKNAFTLAASGQVVTTIAPLAPSAGQ